MNKIKPFKILARLISNYDQFTPERRVQPGVSMFDPGRGMPWFCLALKVDMLCAMHMEGRLVNVVVDPFISKHLLPHRKA